MNFNIEKKISNFIESQFPQFYLSEGPNFILFVKAYYEWLESEGQAINQARSLFDIRDIDNTLDQFLTHFQTKYLYGIPFNVIVNPRYLLKHILDVYRSKGSIQCYKLLFRLIYNQDAEIYLPSEDVLRLSAGTWIQPQYVEVTNTPNLQSYVGQTVIGASSNTTAIIESFITQPINDNIIATLYYSNMEPKGGSFAQGEKIVILDQYSNTTAITAAPSVIGSLDHLNIINGGEGFNVGDVIKIAHYYPTNNAVVSYGVDGLLRVNSLKSAVGALSFDIVSGGFGFTPNTNVFLYRDASDTTGIGASVSIGNFTYNQSIQYNTDLIVDYANVNLNAVSYGLPANSSANDASTIQSALAFTNSIFGTIGSLTNISTGNGYTNSAHIFVRSTQNSIKNLPGTISYSTSSNTITGTSTTFPYYFSNGDVIRLQANTSNNQTVELQVIKSVDSNTQITLYGPPTYSSTSAAAYRTAPVILPSQYALYDPVMVRSDGTINGENDEISGIPASGNSIIATVSAINSGKGYVDGEFVYAYLSGGLAPLTILNPGTGYSNGDTILFSGGGVSRQVQGFVTTDSSGRITAASYANGSGSGYKTTPSMRIISNTGTGGILTTSVVEFNTFSQVTGKVVKAGIGKQQGYWSTTRGFLDSDKYIQDSYFYQDFSYQIRVADTLENYKSILYDTFHTSGSELFGEFYQLMLESSPATILYEQTEAAYQTYLSIDTTLVDIDTTATEIDQNYTF